MATFKELSKFADKESKFKQGYALALALETMNNANAYLNSMGMPGTYSADQLNLLDDRQKGVCADLTMTFLKDMLGSYGLIAQNKVTPRFQRNKGVSAKTNAVEANTAAASAFNQYAFGLVFKIRGEAAATDDLAVTHGLVPVGDPTVLDNELVSGHYETGFAFGVGMYVGYSFTKPATEKDPTTSAGHAIGFVRFNDGIHFFDSNVGGYRVHSGQFENFMKCYIGILSNAFKWDIYSGIARYYQLAGALF
jgi:hypothetical protein